MKPSSAAGGHSVDKTATAAVRAITDNQNFADFVLSPNKLDQYTIVHRLNEQRNLDYLDWEWLKDPNSVLYRELEARTLYHKIAISANQLVIQLLKGKAEMAIKKINAKKIIICH